jgi:hypothetical protein
MGEFSSGKSSFVNAFIGAEVAATGITPTTATINVVKYAHERGGRLIGRDGAARELALGRAARGAARLTPDEAAAIDRVEIGCRCRADQGQHHRHAGPQLDLARARGHGARVHRPRRRGGLGVHRGPGRQGQRAQGARRDPRRGQARARRAQQARSAGRTTCARWSSTSAASSASASSTSCRSRPAPRWRGSAGGDDDGGWARAAGALEERFFAQARAIKRGAVARRLPRRRGGAGHGRTPPASARGRAGRPRARRPRAGGRGPPRLGRRRGGSRATALATAVGELYRRAAHEVIELVRPRQLPFGSHSGHRRGSRLPDRAAGRRLRGDAARGGRSRRRRLRHAVVTDPRPRSSARSPPPPRRCTTRAPTSPASSPAARSTTSSSTTCRGSRSSTTRSITRCFAPPPISRRWSPIRWPAPGRWRWARPGARSIAPRLRHDLEAYELAVGSSTSSRPWPPRMARDRRPARAARGRRAGARRADPRRSTRPAEARSSGRWSSRWSPSTPARPAR